MKRLGWGSPDSLPGAFLSNLDLSRSYQEFHCFSVDGAPYDCKSDSDTFEWSLWRCFVQPWDSSIFVWMSWFFRLWSVLGSTQIQSNCLSKYHFPEHHFLHPNDMDRGYRRDSQGDPKINSRNLPGAFQKLQRWHQKVLQALPTGKPRLTEGSLEYSTLVNSTVDSTTVWDGKNN